MLTLKKFTGINNVLPTERLGETDLRTATDLDVGMSGELLRRSGYSEVIAGCHKNLFQANGFMLATCDGDVKSIVGTNETVLAPAVGTSRMWYVNLPDGRVAYSNGLVTGIVTATERTDWGVPIPASTGVVTDVAGQLFQQTYTVSVTHVRLSDGLEGGPKYLSSAIDLVNGGISIVNLPMLAGHSTNVYINDFLAGNTVGSSFTFTGKNTDLRLPCRTDHCEPAPAGRLLTMWRGRVLVADGGVLWASKPYQWELFDRRRDFKQFTSDITMLITVDDGLYVGTEEAMYFLQGGEFDKLQLNQVGGGGVVLGSGVSIDGEKIRVGEGVGQGSAMMCIHNRQIVAGIASGQLVRLTEGRYETDATEVWATFRISNGIPQYIAIPQ